MDFFDELDLTDSSGAPAKPIVPADFDFMTEFLDNPGEDNPEIANLNLSCEDEPEWCEGCKKLKQDITGLQQEYKQNILTLKQKIVPTDLLIKRYNSKCQEYDVQTKKLEDLTKRLDKTERACTTLEAQLQSSLCESQPVKDANYQLERDKRDLVRRCSDLGDQVNALQSTCTQYETMNRNSEGFNNETKTLQKKLKQAEDAKSKADQQLAKLKEEVSNEKLEVKKEKRLRRSKENELEKLQKKLEKYSNLLKTHGHLRGAQMHKHSSPDRAPQLQESVEADDALVEEFTDDDGDDEMEGVAMEAEPNVSDVIENVTEVMKNKAETEDADCALLDKLLEDMTEVVQPETEVIPTTSNQYDADSDSDLSVGFTSLLNMQPALSPLPPSPVIGLESDPEEEVTKSPSLARRQRRQGKQNKQPSPLARKQAHKQLAKKSIGTRTKPGKPQSPLTEKTTSEIANTNSGKTGLGFSSVKFVSGGIQTLEEGKAVISRNPFYEKESDKKHPKLSSQDSLLRNDLSLSGSSGDESNAYDCGDDTFFTTAQSSELEEKENSLDTPSGKPIQFDFHELYKQLPRQSTRSFEVNQNLDETQLSPRRARTRSLPGVQGHIGSPVSVQVSVKPDDDSRTPPRRQSLGSPIRRSPRLCLSPVDAGIKERLRSRSPLHRNDAFDEKAKIRKGSLQREGAIDNDSKSPKSQESLVMGQNSTKEIPTKISPKTRERTVSLNASTVTLDKSPGSGGIKIFTRSRSHLSVVFKDNVAVPSSDKKLAIQPVISLFDIANMKTNIKNNDSSVSISVKNAALNAQTVTVNKNGADLNIGAKTDASVDHYEHSKDNHGDVKIEKVSIGRRSLRSHSTSSDVAELPNISSKSLRRRSDIVEKKLRSLGRKVKKGNVVNMESKTVDTVSRDQGVLSAKQKLRGRSAAHMEEEVVLESKQAENIDEPRNGDENDEVMSDSNQQVEENASSQMLADAGDTEMIVDDAKDDNLVQDTMNESGDSEGQAGESQIIKESLEEDGTWESRRKKRGSGGFTVSGVKFEDGERTPTSPGVWGKRPRLGKSFSEDWGGLGRETSNLNLKASCDQNNQETKTNLDSLEEGNALPLDSSASGLAKADDQTCVSQSKGTNKNKHNKKVPCVGTCGKTSLLPLPEVAAFFEAEKSPDFTEFNINEIFREMHTVTDLLNESRRDSATEVDQNSQSGHFTLTVDSEIEEAFRDKISKSADNDADPTCRRGSKRLKSVKRSKKLQSQDSKCASEVIGSGDINDNITPQDFIPPIFLPSKSDSVVDSDLPPFTRMSQSCVTVVSPETSGIPGEPGSVGRSETPLSISSIESTASSPVSPLPMSPMTFPERITPISPLPPTPEPLRRHSLASDTSLNAGQDIASIEQTPTPSLVSPLPETPHKSESPVPSTSFNSPARFDASVPKDVLNVKPQSRRNLKNAFLSNDLSQDNVNKQNNVRQSVNETCLSSSESSNQLSHDQGAVGGDVNNVPGMSLKKLNKKQKRRQRKETVAARDKELGVLPEDAQPSDAVAMAPPVTKKKKKKKTANTVQVSMLDNMKNANTVKDVERIGAAMIEINSKIEARVLAEHLVKFMDKKESNMTAVLLTVAGKHKEFHTVPVLAEMEKKFIRLVLFLKENLDSFWSPFLQVLSNSILKDKSIKILPRMGLCRIFTGLCRLSANMEQIHVLIYDIMKESHLGYAHPMLLSAVCGVWKGVLVNNPGWSVGMMGPVNIIDIIEFIILKDAEIIKPHLILMKICGWQPERVQDRNATDLARTINKQLRSFSRKKPLKQDAQFNLHKALELLAVNEGWWWTHSVLWREIFLPAVEELNKMSENASNPANQMKIFNEYLANMVQTIGVIYSQCPPTYTDTVIEITKKLAELLEGRLTPVALGIQIKAVEVLFILSPFNLDMAATVTTKWTEYCRKNSLDIPPQIEEKMETFRNKFKERLPYLAIKEDLDP